MDQDAATRIVLRPLATPLPLGFLGLVVAASMSACLHLGWIPSDGARGVALALVLFAAPVQLVACIFGFLGRDAVAATGMGLQFPAWIGTGALLLAGPTSPSVTSGVFSLVVGTVLLIPAVIGLTTKVVAGAVMATTAAHFLLLGGYQVSGNAAAESSAGALGLFLAVLALYAALAFELEDARRTTVLSVLRRGLSAEAMRPSLPAQVRRVENEAGVREQL